MTIPERTLRKLLVEGATGRLVSDDSNRAVYLMSNEIVGATSPKDPLCLLNQLERNQGIDASAANRLRQDLASSVPIFGELFDLVDQRLLDHLIQERFVENLSQFIDGVSECRFEPMKTVFIDTIQMGHEPNSLLDTCRNLLRESSQIQTSSHVTAHTEDATDPAQQNLLFLVEELSSIEDILAQSPMESIATRALIAQMLDKNILKYTDAPRAQQPSSADSSEVSLQSNNDLLGGAEEEDDLLDPDSGLPKSQGGAGDLSSLNAWLKAADEPEDGMEAFEDHDQERGGNSGNFSSQKNHMNRVEVVDLSQRLATDELSKSSYSAPALSPEAALHKIQVLNQVLTVVSEALDQTGGPDTGRTSIQILLEAAPHSFKAVFNGLKAKPDGGIEGEHLLSNLTDRPASEHRRLLHQGVLNLIERALSTAADELPDESIDQVLESVAGYRQRLGM